ncbi:membrane-bound lytic murein transglycosylase MltF [Marinobacterium arenosum]|uniref:membrane-bound lytic murein transglycosylase MltF n=1 Tax=Marinobacterium arenosum TaxID=2862496 RepID=UPI001C963BD3|nr:membrane-bound lytic murein transglycosylase MltF [Marinobacterium arenosum]MBY4675758.1 membrane-bound lytic murein transglycosylase MltF [Marinobacterium arenosum]
MLSTPRRRKTAIYFVSLLLLFSLPLLLSYNSKTQLEIIQESGALRLLTRNSPSTYFLDHGRPAGFEYELSKAFADHIGVKLQLIQADSLGELIERLRYRDGHIAAAVLSVTPERQREFDFSPPYLASAATLIYRVRQGNPQPRELEDLYGSTLSVLPNSSHAELLRELQLQAPKLDWQEPANASEIDLMEQVHNGELDYTVMDSTLFDAQRSYFPGLNKAFELAPPQQVAWMLARHHDDSLKQALNAFFALESTQALIEKLKTKYFDRHNQLNFFDTVTFKGDLEQRLPKYEKWFKQAEKETGLPWKLLAAVAYQESHWNPKAVSPTGVRGIMMLTHAAAKEVGVKNRIDPKQSILGGAKYLQSVMQKIPERIQAPDRIWFALAGYNVGFGHLEDARILTARAGKNPDSWVDVREFLPLLTKEQYYSTVRRGYARGYEPVIYVRNIRKYLQLLTWESRVAQMRSPEESGNEPNNDKPALPTTIAEGQSVDRIPKAL